MATQTAPITLPDQAFRDLVLLAESSELLRKISEAMPQLSRANSIKAAVAALEKATETDAEKLTPVISAVLTLNGVRRNLHVEPDELMRLIDDAIDRQVGDEWGEKNLSGWRSARGSLTLLLNADSHLAVLEKAVHLAYAYQNILTRVRLFTDVRPVFNESGDKVHRGVLSFVLSLDYQNGDNYQRLDFALDAADIAELKRLCERAEKKAAALQQSLVWPISIAGELD